MALSESILAQIREEWQAATNGAKSALVRKWAQTLNVSYQTLYRGLAIGRRRKKGDRKIDGIERAAEIIAQIKKRPPQDAGEIPTDLAVRQAVDNGLIPEEFQDVSIGTFNRIIRECGLNQRVRRVQRYQACYPNQLHHVDASSSQFFYVHRQEGEEYILRMHNSSGLGYKNKPVPVRLRPWVYGLTDDYSGVHMARYVAALGESLADNLQFLAWAWGCDQQKTFFGVPDRIKADQGPLMKGEASKEWLTRLDITLEGSIPGQKEAHGKIERPWRTMWGRFEKTFFVESDWKRFEITLSELNRRFEYYLEEYNNRPHRYERDVNRIDAWRRINLRGGAVALPAGAIATAARRHQRTVGADGCISLDGVTYEVKGLHAAKVRVYEGIYEDRIVVEDLRTGEKYEAKKFAPTPLDTYKAHKHTAHQVALKTAETLQMTNTLYQEAGAATKVTRLPTRVKEERQMVNPFDVDAYPSIDAAMRDFASICAFAMDAENTKIIRNLIIEGGLKRSAVRELALEIQAEYQREQLG